jgi:ribosomal-protein-alanine N-acetyltransferase
MIMRKVKASDIIRLYHLDQLCFPPGMAFSFKTLCHYILYADSISYLIEAAGQILGFVSTRICSRYKAQLVTIDIHPHYRRQGLGQILLTKAEQKLIQRGSKWVSLEVAVNNAAAIAFYHKNGYRIKRLIKNYYHHGGDAYLMQKKL